MKNYALITLCFIYCLSASANIVCQMSDIDNPSNMAQAIVENTEGAWADSDLSLDKGDHAFSFQIMVDYEFLTVIIYEDIRVQDEVGSLGCEISEKGSFCFENIQGFDGETLFHFSCEVI